MEKQAIALLEEVVELCRECDIPYQQIRYAVLVTLQKLKKQDKKRPLGVFDPIGELADVNICAKSMAQTLSADLNEITQTKMKELRSRPKEHYQKKKRVIRYEVVA